MLREIAKSLITIAIFLGIVSLWARVISPLPIGMRGDHRTSQSESGQTNPFESVALTAKAAYVYDIATGEMLYEKNSELQFPLASLTKIMTALVAREYTNPQTIITLTQRDISAEGDSGLRVDEKWRFSDLVDFTLLTSSNDGARALASVGALSASRTHGGNISFVDLMNEKARDLGLTQTFFLNEIGLDESSSTSGAYGSAKDVAMLFAHALNTYPELYAETAQNTGEINSLDFTHTATNTNTIVSQIPGLVASKTGFTDLAGGNLAIIFEAGPLHPIAVVVLGSTADGRFVDVERLVETTIKRIITSS